MSKRIRRKTKRIRKKFDTRLSQTYKCKKCGRYTLGHWSSLSKRKYEEKLYKLRLCPKCYEKGKKSE